MTDKIYIVDLHSYVGLLTSSSTETFVISESRVDDAFKEVFRMLRDEWNHNGETDFEKYDEYEYKDEYILPSTVDTKDVWIIFADQHDTLLNWFIEKHFNPINYEYK